MASSSVMRACSGTGRRRRNVAAVENQLQTRIEHRRRASARTSREASDERRAKNLPRWRDDLARPVLAWMCGGRPPHVSQPKDTNFQ
jgi:hypothetical protein